MSSSIDSVYAHTQPYAPPACWQTLEDHLRAVADRAAQFAGVFDSADWAWNAGWLHDIGKAAPEFQKYLRACNGLDDPRYEAIDSGGINHSSAGAALAGELFQVGDGRPRCIDGTDQRGARPSRPDPRRNRRREATDP